MLLMDEHPWVDATNRIPFRISVHLWKDQVTDRQNRLIDLVYKALSENIPPASRPVAFGGRIDEEEFEKYLANFSAALLQHPGVSDAKPWLKILGVYKSFLKDRILQSVALKFSLVDLSLPELFFASQPRITWNSGKIDRMELSSDGYTLSSRIFGIVPYALGIGLTAKKKPFFFPNPFLNTSFEKLWADERGEIFKVHDLLSFFAQMCSISPSVFNFGNVNDESELISNNPNPFESFLLGDHALIGNLGNLGSDYEFQGRKEPICIGVIYPNKMGTHLILFSGGNISIQSILRTTAALCHLGASCYEFPRTKILKSRIRKPKEEEIGPIAYGRKNYNKPIFQVWSEYELTELAAKRGLIRLPVWSEEELNELAVQRGIVELPVWTEEDLEKDAQERVKQADPVPNWQPNPLAISCPNCEYTLLPEWAKCPVCDCPNPKFSGNEHGNEEKTENDDFWTPPSD
jgi:hypothetical protein